MKHHEKHQNRRDTMNAEKAPQDPTSAPIASLRLSCQTGDSHSELLILPDGQVLVHNLTPAFADLLNELNPDEEQIASRSRHVKNHASRITSHELPD